MKGIVAFYPTDDLVKTKSFYEEVLSLPQYMDQGSAVLYDTGYGYLGFCQYPQHRECQHVCISFNMESTQAVDEYYVQLSKKLHCLHAPAWHEHFLVYSFFFQDVNGYTLEVQFIKESSS